MISTIPTYACRIIYPDMLGAAISLISSDRAFSLQILAFSCSNMIREARSLPLLAFLIFDCLVMLLPVASRGDYSCSNSESVVHHGVNISYPFWLHDESKQISPYCGYQSFMLTLQRDIPILRLGDHNYTVLHIDYTETVVSLTDVDIFDPVQASCPRLRQNVTLPSNVPLSYAHTHQNLTIFFNCSNSVDSGWPNNEIPCLNSNSYDGENKHSYVFQGIPNKFESPEDCSEVVVCPVLKSLLGNDVREEYAQLLQMGFELHWTVDNNGNCEDCENSRGRCGYRTDGATLAPTCFWSDGKIEVPQRVERKKHTTLIIGIVIGAMVGFILACFISSYLLCFREPDEKEDQAIQNFILQYESTTPKRYTYTEIKRMTKSFSDKLGNGGYGSVFKGSLQDGRSAAVKILSETKGNGEDFINEVASISRTSHINIVALLGFCLEGSKRALVYEFMSNGSLDKFIFDSNLNMKNSQLSREKLYDIAIGIARGLEYLHRGCNTRIVHFDIKPHNILLDQDFCPKISDFGLAKTCIQKESIMSTIPMRGTPGYIAPELFSRSFGTISSKSDVYSYGMMVLEMVGGRKNFNARADHTSETYFPHWVYDNLDNYCNLTASASASEVSSKTEEIERKMILVGLWCIQIKPENRPSISMVVDMLEGSISVLQMPPKPEFS